MNIFRYCWSLRKTNETKVAAVIVFVFFACMAFTVGMTYIITLIIKK